MHITPVILSGGAGTRLWPMSRPECPKQFLALTGDKTMFQMTLERVPAGAQYAAPIIVANAAHADLVDSQLTGAGVCNATILLEPCARNTAPAIALAALSAVAAKDTSAVLLVMPSDHVILNQPAFDAAIAAALPVVNQGWLVTFGIAPTGPETGYGYIQTCEVITSGVHKVSRFVEKPDAVRAAEMIISGNYVWNGGIFLFRADTYLAALAVHAPDILAAAQSAMQDAVRKNGHVYPHEAAFAASPSDSIDYAIMEKYAQVAVVPVSMGWSDVGSWDAIFDIGGNPSAQHILEIGGEGNLIRSDGIRIHTVGMENMIVVASGNDVLILPRGTSQDVKKIVEALKAQLR
jgi:mannose-1-phosphate guanylyltransferase